MALLLRANPAPGVPGASPTWTRADKDGVGTALLRSDAQAGSSEISITTSPSVIQAANANFISFLVLDGCC